jgi:hypothetical protein
MALDPHLPDPFTDIGGGTLITIKRDGRPPSSPVTRTADPATRPIRVSVTDGRATTRNLRRDPRPTDQFARSAGAVGEGTVILTPPAADPQAAAAPVDDGRVLLTAASGHVHGRVRP